MYYKIENKDSEIYKALHSLRIKEYGIEKENRQMVEEKVGLHFQEYLGHHGQQSFCRVTEYEGFCFTEHEKVDPKIWNKKEDGDNIVYTPNRKTKVGREMKEFLLNGLKKSFFQEVFDILKIERTRRFTFPYVEIVGELILVYIDDKKEDDNLDECLIEITKKEFMSLLQSYLSKPLP